MSLMEELTYALVVLTLGLVLVTGFYAYVTFRILRANEAVVAEMREERFAAARPYVVASPFVRTGAQLIYLAIENTGRAPAQKLTLQLAPDFRLATGSDRSINIADLSAFREEIQSLAPGSRLIFMLGSGPELFSKVDERSPLTFDLRARYSYSGRVIEEITPVDLRPFANSHVPHDPIAEELERLRKSIDGVGQQMRTLAR